MAAQRTTRSTDAALGTENLTKIATFLEASKGPKK